MLLLLLLLQMEVSWRTVYCTGRVKAFRISNKLLLLQQQRGPLSCSTMQQLLLQLLKLLQLGVLGNRSPELLLLLLLLRLLLLLLQQLEMLTNSKGPQTWVLADAVCLAVSGCCCMQQ